MFIKFETKEEAVAIANDSDYALAAGVWTKSLDTSLFCSEKLVAGTVWVNGMMGQWWGKEEKKSKMRRNCCKFTIIRSADIYRNNDVAFFPFIIPSVHRLVGVQCAVWRSENDRQR